MRIVLTAETYFGLLVQSEIGLKYGKFGQFRSDRLLLIEHYGLNVSYLINAVFGLEIRIVSCPDRSHGRGFVSGVGLRRVLEIGIGTSGTVDANVASHADVRAAMGLAHDGDNSDLWRKSIDELP